MDNDLYTKENGNGFVENEDTKGLGKAINAVPKPKQEIGIDVENNFIDTFIDAGINSRLDTAQLQSFTTVSQNRETIYSLLDTMAQDSTISAILETYAEDATEANEQGQIVWCESNDTEISKFVTYLLDSMNVDKNIYKWVYSLCKYGDVYLKLYRNSEFQDGLLSEEQNEKSSKVQHLNESKLDEDVFSKLDKMGAKDEPEHETLNEDVNVRMYKDNDNYSHYVEMVPNPAGMFELTKFGKTYAYIQAGTINNQLKAQDPLLAQGMYRYKFNKRDVDIYDATCFVHAALEDNSDRIPEEVQIFLDESGTEYEPESTALKYTVKRGQSLLYNSFKIWREMTMLENAMILNRVTKSSIVRIVNVEVGDMPKEQIGPHLQGIKNLMEQKTAINEGNSLSEYTNPGPVENNIYIPTHNSQGTITVQSLGDGEVNVGNLNDINFFRDKLFGSLKVPKQFYGFTEDGAGFNGGESLSILSSRYAKTVKRIQNTVIQMLTDAVNLMLLDKQLDSYVNRFTLHMLPPTTQDEITRRDNASNRLGVVRDTMDLLSDIEDASSRLRIVKCMLKSIVNDEEVTALIDEQIQKLKVLETVGFDTTPEMPVDQGTPLDTSGVDLSGGGGPFGGPGEDMGGDMGGGEFIEPDMGGDMGGGAAPDDSVNLPTPADLGVDLTNNAEF